MPAHVAQGIGIGVLILSAYWLPGAALRGLVEWRGLGRLTYALLPVPLALVGVPIAFSSAAALVPFQPSLFALAILSAALFALGSLLRRRRWQPALEFRPRTGATRPRALETWAVGLLLVGVAVLAMLPRVHMLVYGSDVTTTVISDTYWHLSEVTSIASSGLPPRHYLFPDVPLVYYYWSWIYPATLATWPLEGQSLARLLTVHTFVNLLSFLGVAYALLRASVRPWGARLAGVAMLTLVGGFDYFTGPAATLHEWWQAGAPWLVSGTQLPGLLTSYMWVPQHLAGAMAFLLIAILVRHMRGSLAWRAALAVLAAVFMFGTSTFVWLSFIVGVAVWGMLWRRAWWQRKAWRCLVVPMLLFAILAAPQFLLALSNRGAVGWGDFHAVVLGGLTGAENGRTLLIDQLLTWLGLPLVAAWVLLVEMGLVFGLYCAYVVRAARRGAGRWERFLALYPLAYIPIALLLLPPNFSMRGMLPVQIVMVLAAAAILASLNWRSLRTWHKAALLYLFILTLAAQAISPWIEWAYLARRGVGEVLRLTQGWGPLRASAGSEDVKYLIPPAGTHVPSLAYISWANENTPADALFVEEGLAGEPNQYHLLERMRFADPSDIAQHAAGERDFTLAGGRALEAAWASNPGNTLLGRALTSPYVLRRKPPLYYVSRSGDKPDLGTPVYRDDYVLIYHLTD
jgi:hypothetical protein